MYGKIFSSMYDSTLSSTGWHTMVVFQQLIVLADRDGVVDMTVESISRRTTIPLEIVQEGITNLMMEDKNSRCKQENGRRITLIDDRPWGWKIVNYQHYSSIRSAEERREYQRVYQENYRKQLKTSVNNRKHHKPSVTEKTDVSVSGDVSGDRDVKEKIAVSEEPKQPAPSFNDWWQETKQSPAYQGINLEREMAKMQVWLTTPAGKGRKITKKFVVSWLNKIDVPCDGPMKPKPKLAY